MAHAADDRALVVLADGAQAAFAAGAVAALAERGTTWGRGVAGGLGAQVAVLALAGEAAEAERRWRRQTDNGCPLLRPRIARERERLGAGDGLLLLPDPWRSEGWLDPVALDEHLAPERGGFAERLRRDLVPLEIGVVDLGSGRRCWEALETVDGTRAFDLLRASAGFAGGWGPVECEDGDVLWGGAAAMASALPDLRGGSCDLVCGFPVPPVGRGRRCGLAELIQARDEACAGEWVASWVEHCRDALGGVRVVAPDPAGYAAWSARDTADLALEWPLPGEHNAELTTLAIDYGRWAGGRAVGAR